MAAIHKGRCFCGAVHFEAEGDPAMQGYCHCADCRAWSGSPVTAYAMWPNSRTRITEGEEHVLSFQRDEGSSIRRACKRCGGAVPSLIPMLDMSDVYAPLLPDFEFRPQAHIQCADAVIEIADELPRFDRWPPQG